MKRILLLLIPAFFFLSVQAQQSVGIGTSTPHPSAILELSSNSQGLLLPRMTGAQRVAIPDAKGLIVYDTDTDMLMQNDGVFWRKLLNSSFWNRTINSNYVYNGSDSIGIGTSLVKQRLHIENGKIYMRDNRPNNSPHIIFEAAPVNYKEGGLQWHRGVDTMASLDYVADPNNSNYIRLSVSGKSKIDFMVNASGRVGMGVINPLVKLHIRDVDATEMIMLDGASPMIQFRKAVGSPIPTYESTAFVQVSGDNLRVGTNSSNTTGKFVVRTGGGDRLQVDAEGNLSIGTTDVAAGYKVNIAGKLICEEIKVQLRGNWPDYVFADGYQLRSLPDLQKFIRQNKHLPNIPAAAEIEKSGLALGEMQTKMMEKIEELTLYILELKNEIDALKKSVPQNPAL